MVLIMAVGKSKMTLQVKKRTSSEGLLDEEIEAFGNQAETEVKKPVPKSKVIQAPVKKVVRDSFSMPEDDYSLIAVMRSRALKNELAVTKAEVIRAGLQVLNALSDSELSKALRALEKVKTGRPKV